jgi:hypothetical protein
MFRKRLVATAAAAPLLIFASGAFAETTISDTRTTGVSTATIANGAADDIKISNAGKVKPTTGGTAGAPTGAVTVNSNNDVVNDGGEISTSKVDNVAGILVASGVTADITNKGQIRHDDDYDAKDTDKDGDLDGPLAEGTGRYGILVNGSLTGNVINDSGGTITIDGNDSAGIWVKGPMTGDLVNRGAITVTGTNARGIDIDAPLTGDLTVRGGVNVVGENATGVTVDDVSGAFLIQGNITSRGYRYASRPLDPEILGKLDADDLLQGGSAVVVAGNIGGGVLLDVAPSPNTYDTDNDGIPNLYDDDDDNDGVKDDTDDDDDNDTVKDVDDKDLDNDGIDDAAEGAASITTFGQAPALLIGSTTESLTIGKVAASGDDAYGLVIRGAVSANGLFDDISATGIKIGLGNGQTTTIENGISITGAVTAISYNNSATAIHLGDGAIVDELNFSGTIFASSTATSAPLTSEDPYAVFGLRIDQLANTGSLNNGGVISAILNGERGDAYAIWDRSGTLTSLNNTGVISAIILRTDDKDDTDDADNDPTNETVVGQAVAIDVSYAQAGVTIVQNGIDDGDDDYNDDTEDTDTDGDGVDDDDEPAIIGNIRFGAFADTLDLRNGAFLGDVSFGAGADVYNLSGGAEAEGAITDSDGQLTVNVGQSKLTVTNAAVIDATAINIAGNGQVMFTADPAANGGAGANTRFDVATANIANGAKLGITLTDLIDGPERYTVIKTDTPGGLTVGTLDQSLTGNAPYLFVAQAAADTSAGEVYIDIRRRTATEMDLNQSQSLALDAVYEALGLDDELRDSFLSADTRKEFLDRYDQMLPDQGEGLFSSLDTLSRMMSRLTATRPDLRQRYGPDSFWIQEINAQVMRDAGVSAGSETKAFGFAGGYESMGADGGALGATLAFVTSEEKDDVAKVGEETSVSLLEAGVYWRRSVGKFTINARGAAGYGWFTGDRVYVDSDNGTILEATSDWTGLTGVASVAGEYEFTAGRFFARPSVSLDYLYLREGAHSESSKSSGLPLDLQERTSDRLSATASLNFGATFGRDLWWRPELRVGYRQHLAGELGDTLFRFREVGGDYVALPATEAGDGAFIIGFSLRAGTAMSYVAVEGEYEAVDQEDVYNLQLSGRMMF